MGDFKNLSYTNIFNQQKIIDNDSVPVSIPISGATPDTLLTISTGQIIRPTARVFVEIGGKLAPAYQSRAETFNSLGVSVAFYPYFDASNNFVLQSYSLEASPVNAIIHYRIYKDGRPE